jgi:sulfate transport system substrate-binding protein
MRTFERSRPVRGLPARAILAACWVLAVIAIVPPLCADEVTLLNVSYDPTRELWRDINAAFAPVYRQQTGKNLVIRQSHGGSASQARAVIDGLEADVVTLALWPDTDALREAGLIADGWEAELPNHSVPYTSTIVFVVRKGNPKGIKDWADLVKEGVTVITPNPKTSGNAKLSFLAAWGSVTQRGGTDEQARDLVTRLYRNTPVLDVGARGSTITFIEKRIGDVHLTWENEAYREVEEAGGTVEIVYPPISFLAEPPVAVVTENVRRRGTGAAARAYLAFLYTSEGQEILARHFYRPTDPNVLARHRATFPDMRFFRIEDVATDWNDAYRKFFRAGQIFDAIYPPERD